jgi:hypothetical protein
MASQLRMETGAFDILAWLRNVKAMALEKRSIHHFNVLERLGSSKGS